MKRFRIKDLPRETLESMVAEWALAKQANKDHSHFKPIEIMDLWQYRQGLSFEEYGMATRQTWQRRARHARDYLRAAADTTCIECLACGRKRGWDEKPCTCREEPSPTQCSTSQEEINYEPDPGRGVLRDTTPEQTEPDIMLKGGAAYDDYVPYMGPATFNRDAFKPKDPAPLTGISRHLGWAVRRIWDAVAG